MKISRKPTPPRPTAPSRPSRLVTADTALARAKISGMGLGGPNWLPELPEGGSSAAGNLWDWIRRDHYRYAGVIGRLCHACKREYAFKTPRIVVADVVDMPAGRWPQSE